MFTWYPNVPYANPPAFARRVVAELQYQVHRLAHHPAIILWTGSLPRTYAVLSQE